MTPKLHSILVRLAFITIFVSTTSIAYVLLPEKPTANKTSVPQEATPISTSTVFLTTSAPATSVSSLPEVAQLVRAGGEKTPPKTTSSTESFQTATLSVNDKNYTLQFNTEENLLTAMRRLETSSVAPFSFSGKEYAGIGFFVDGINDIKNNPTAGKYWVYYLNGQPAPVGISTYLLKSGDIINWQYGTKQF
ncbi:MAG: hypothetical protein A3J93_03960 [Candidatus Magasanikbacteria bacterium RIFOXYC2_FULL_42_28]|uniref:Transcobalamin-like C-terminal domain-containing protein n=1 Tax=Candidatus Magasanikbacteria bacterium RIFOXYC2_FULL_42_28 TaxID=1798704 RepID=A0A1F6NUP4_9BACT|nr:MAG: hypothetical protein A3J93_03960 [Candidatus Magasanikbacteria bacterium RIFOXYC2_FULL_42_28]